MAEDLGMLFIPKLGLLTKIRKDSNGLLYVNLPSSKKKHYLGEEEARKCLS